MTKSYEEIIAGMTPEQQEQQREIYFGKLEAVGKKPHHKSKLESLLRMWDEYEAGEEEVTTKAMTTQQRREEMIREQHRKLIRVRITNHNPANKGKQGEVVTVGNSFIGVVKKVVPYNCDAANDYHLPMMIYNFLKQKKYNQKIIRTINGRKVDMSRNMPEYSFEILPPLTQKEKDELARKQAMARGVEVD